jgi:hypothetical protein
MEGDSAVEVDPHACCGLGEHVFDIPGRTRGQFCVLHIWVIGGGYRVGFVIVWHYMLP